MYRKFEENRRKGLRHPIARIFAAGPMSRGKPDRVGKRGWKRMANRRNAPSAKQFPMQKLCVFPREEADRHRQERVPLRKYQRQKKPSSENRDSDQEPDLAVVQMKEKRRPFPALEAHQADFQPEYAKVLPLPHTAKPEAAE